jgi:hypothetical protein
MPILSLMIFSMEVKLFHIQLFIGETMDAINATTRQIIAITAMTTISAFIGTHNKKSTNNNLNEPSLYYFMIDLPFVQQPL